MKLFNLLSITLAIFAGHLICLDLVRAKDANADKTSSKCEGETSNLSCDNADYVINVTHTVYGRYSILPCNNGTGSGWSTKCNTANALQVVRELCQNKQSCRILASNTTFTAYDQCPETPKYLEVKYTCVRKEPPTESPQKLVAPQMQQNFMPNTDFYNNMPKYGSGSSSTGFEFNVNSNNNMCPETTAEGITWSQTARGVTVYRRCPNGGDRHAQWRCLDQQQPRWDSNGPDFSPCGGVTPSVGVRNSLEQQVCEPTLMGGITWPRASPGEMSVMPCPLGARGYMRWRCVAEMQDQVLLVDWERRGPDSTECESSWVQTVDSQGINPENVLTIIERTAEKTVASVVGSAVPIQYGRDLQAIIRHLGVVQRTAELGLHSGQLSADRTRNLSLALVRAASAVLDTRNAAAWRDLRRQDASSSATRLLDTLERHAIMMAPLSQESNGLEKTVSKNVFLGAGRFNASVAAPIGLLFQPATREVDIWPGELDQVQLSRAVLESMQSNKTSKTLMLSLSFVVYNNLARYLGTKLADESATSALQQLQSRMPMTTLMPYNPNNNSMLILPNNYPPIFYEPLLIVNSRVISAAAQQQNGMPTTAAAVEQKPVILAESVIIRLEHLIKDQRGTPMCVYWAYQYGGAEPGYEAAWSRDGCSVLQTSRDFTVCSCTHMGSFAVLFDVNGFFSTSPTATMGGTGRDYGNVLSDSRGFSQLVTFTAFGYLLAIVCLILTLISLNCYKFGSTRHVKGAQPPVDSSVADDAPMKSFHKHLVFCFICGHVVFLLSVVDRTFLRTGGACETAGMLVHWCCIAVFMWMLIETAYLYKKLTSLCSDGSSTATPRSEASRSKKWYYYGLAVGYGLPTLAVVLAVAVSGGSLRNYATERYCLLRIDSLAVLLGFIVPALSALLLTWLLLAVCFYVLTKKAKHCGVLTNGSHQVQKQRGMQTIKCWMLSTVVISTMLAAAWATGLLYLRTDAVALAYLFVAFNSLLGAMVLLLHVLRDEKVCRKLQRFSTLRFFFSASAPSTASSTRWTAAAVSGGLPQHCNGGPPVGTAQQWFSQQSSPSSAYGSGTGGAAQPQDLQLLKNANWPQSGGAVGTANSDTATMIYGGSMWNNQLADLAGALPPHHPHMHHHHTMCHGGHQQLPPGLLAQQQQQQQRDRDSGVSCPSSQRESPPTTTVAGNNSLALAPATANGCVGCCCTSNYCAHVHHHAAAAMHHHQHQPSSTNGGEYPYRIGGSETVRVGGGSMLYSEQDHIYQEIPNHYNMQQQHQCGAGVSAMHPPLPITNGGMDAATAHRTLLMQQHQQQVVAAAAAHAQRQRLAAANHNTNETASTDADDDDDNDDDEANSTEPSQSGDESSSSSCGEEHKAALNNSVNPIAAAAAARARARTGIVTRPASQRHRSGGAVAASAQQQQQQLNKKKSLPLPPSTGLPQHQQQNFLQQNQTQHSHHHHHHQNSGGIYPPQSECSCSSDAYSTNNAAIANNAAAIAARNRFQAAAANAASSRFHSPHRNHSQQRTTPQHFNNSATVNSQHIPACFPLAAANNTGNNNININTMLPEHNNYHHDFRQSFVSHNNNNNSSSFVPMSYANTLPHHAQMPLDNNEQQPSHYQHHVFHAQQQNDMLLAAGADPRQAAAAAHLAQLHHFQQQNRLSAAISNGTLHQMHPAQQQHNTFLSNSTMQLVNGVGGHNMSKLALPSMGMRQHNNNSNGLSFSEC